MPRGREDTFDLLINVTQCNSVLPGDPGTCPGTCPERKDSFDLGKNVTRCYQVVQVRAEGARGLLRPVT